MYSEDIFLIVKKPHDICYIIMKLVHVNLVNIKNYCLRYCWRFFIAAWGNMPRVTVRSVISNAEGQRFQLLAKETWNELTNSPVNQWNIIQSGLVNYDLRKPEGINQG